MSTDEETGAHAELTDQGWKDADGFYSPVRPGSGARTDPRGTYPTGPEVGSHVPNVVALDAEGNAFDLSTTMHEGPTVLVFNRSATW